MTPYDLICQTLMRAEKSKADINKATSIPYGPLGHALEVLIIEGKVLRHGLRYKLTQNGEKYCRSKFGGKR